MNAVRSTLLDGATLLQTDEVLEPLENEQLLWLFVMLTLLLVTARVLGELATRLNLPSVVGELTAGIVLGPSLIDAVVVVTDAVTWLEGEAVDPQTQLYLVEVVAWIGLLMLIVLTGLETDLDLIVAKATESTLIALASIVVPFAVGFAFAWYLPERFIAPGGTRLEFSLFLAVAMSISAIPVIAKILMDMGQIRRDFGQITLAAGMINDTVGWIMLALVAGLARTGAVELSSTLETLLWLAVFLGVGFTVGLRATKWIFVWVDNNVGGQVAKITTLMVLALGVGSFTHALHLEAVLGAFVVGILAGQVNRFDYQTEHTFEVLTMGVFAPVFFATAGLRVDLGTLVDPLVFAVGVGTLAIAVVGKFVGTFVGARAAGLSDWEGITMGAGLNARGAMEIIVATIGLGLEVLTIEMYSIVVMIAIVTSLMAPPLLRWSLPRVEMSEAERERLEREAQLRDSFVANITRVLLPTRGGADTQYAARLLGPLTRGTEIEVTAMYVTDAGAGARGAADGGFVGSLARLWNRSVGRSRTTDGEDGRALARPVEDAAEAVDGGGSSAASDVLDSLTGDGPEESERIFELISSRLGGEEQSPRTLVRAADPGVGGAILGEAENGYDLLVLGESSRGRDPEEPLFSETVDEVVQQAPCPTMVVSTPYSGETALERVGERIQRILLPTVGTEYNRHAAEVAFAIARQENAIVEIVHVVNEPQLSDRFVEQPDLSQAIAIGEEIVDREAGIGRQMGAEVLTTVTVGDRPEVDIVDLADQDAVDLVIMGSDKRPVTRRAFFGHRVEHVVREAPCPVAIISSI
ncbi:cation:proton antiporter [Salinilacihabitans rarus]|uniref:cation:proton antiporter domain-containing protein n=1 Tax=Salinilacihabitans rarus TaxID=2961596 RepID=UPI0020C8EBC6|nr:cation:proton antiporter [Salinilacihabitans rarus]